MMWGRGIACILYMYTCTYASYKCSNNHEI